MKAKHAVILTCLAWTGPQALFLYEHQNLTMVSAIMTAAISPVYELTAVISNEAAIKLFTLRPIFWDYRDGKATKCYLEAA